MKQELLREEPFADRMWEGQPRLKWWDEATVIQLKVKTEINERKQKITEEKKVRDIYGCESIQSTWGSALS